MSDEVDRQAFDEAAGQSRGRLNPLTKVPSMAGFAATWTLTFTYMKNAKVRFSLCVVSAQGCKGPQVQILSLRPFLNQILS
jgi:hypothetical protein